MQVLAAPLQLLAYLGKMISHLIHGLGLSLTNRVRECFQLTKAISMKFELLHQLAMQNGFQGGAKCRNPS